MPKKFSNILVHFDPPFGGPYFQKMKIFTKKHLREKPRQIQWFKKKMRKMLELRIVSVKPRHVFCVRYVDTFSFHKMSFRTQNRAKNIFEHFGTF